MPKLARLIALAALVAAAFAPAARAGGLSDYMESEAIRATFRSQAVTPWAASTAYSVGARVVHANALGKVFEATTAGTSGATAPTWNATLGGTTTDGAVTWTTYEIGTTKRPLAVALIRATRGTWAASTGYANGDTVIPTTANGRIYKVTSAGACTSGATEPTFPTTAGGTVADNTCTWTEQTVALEACQFTEVANAGAYARQTLNPADANWSAPSAGAGTGTGETKNAAAITFPAPTATWGLIFGFAIMDSPTYGAGNCLVYAALTTPKNVNNGDPAPSFAVNALSVQIDN